MITLLFPVTTKSASRKTSAFPEDLCLTAPGTSDRERDRVDDGSPVTDKVVEVLGNTDVEGPRVTLLLAESCLEADGVCDSSEVFVIDS